MCQWIKVTWCTSSTWRVCPPWLNTNTKADPALLTSNEQNSVPPQGSSPKGKPFRCYILWKDTLLSSSNFLCQVPLPRDPLMWEAAEESRKEKRWEEWPGRQAGLGWEWRKGRAAVTAIATKRPRDNSQGTFNGWHYWRLREVRPNSSGWNRTMWIL